MASSSVFCSYFLFIMSTLPGSIMPSSADISGSLSPGQTEGKGWVFLVSVFWHKGRCAANAVSDNCAHVE